MQAVVCLERRPSGGTRNRLPSSEDRLRHYLPCTGRQHVLDVVKLGSYDPGLKARCREEGVFTRNLLCLTAKGLACGDCIYAVERRYCLLTPSNASHIPESKLDYLHPSYLQPQERFKFVRFRNDSPHKLPIRGNMTLSRWAHCRRKRDNLEMRARQPTQVSNDTKIRPRILCVLGMTPSMLLLASTSGGAFENLVSRVPSCLNDLPSVVRHIFGFRSRNPTSRGSMTESTIETGAKARRPSAGKP